MSASASSDAVADLAELRTFVTSVVEVVEVHPRLRRITFGGDDLASFAPVGPDTFLYVLLPPPGRSELTVDRSFSWEAYFQTAVEDRPGGAYYTLRRWDPAALEIEVLFVLHTPSGSASEWAARARPGDPAALWGTRTAFHPPPGTGRYLLVADETGLPAVSAIVESLDLGVPVRVLAEVAGVEERQPIPERDGVEVTWLHRGGAPAGTTTLLAEAATAPRPDGSGHLRLGRRGKPGHDRGPQAGAPPLGAASGVGVPGRLLAPLRPRRGPGRRRRLSSTRRATLVR